MAGTDRTLVIALEAKIDKLLKQTDTAHKAVVGRMDKAEKAATASFAKIEKNGVSAFGKMTTAAKTFVAAWLGAQGISAVVNAVSGAIKRMDDLADAGQRLKVNVETLQALRIAAREAGFELEDADKALTSLRESREKALSGQRGSERALISFAALGIDEAALRKTEDLDQLLQKVSDGAKAIGDKGQAAANLFVIGLDSVKSALLGAEGGLDDFVAQQKEAGKVIDEELVKRAGELNDQWDLMATKLNVAVTPALLHMAEVATPALMVMAETLGFVADRMEDIWKLGELITKGHVSVYGSGSISGLPEAASGAPPSISTADEADWEMMRRKRLRPGELTAEAKGRKILADLARDKADAEADAADAAEEIAEAYATIGQDIRDIMRADIANKTNDMLGDSVDRDAAILHMADEQRAAFTDALVYAFQSGDLKGAALSFIDYFTEKMYRGLADSIYNALFDGLGDLKGGGGLGGILGSLLGAVGLGGGGASSGFGAALSGGIAGHRALGGPVSAGSAYLVGERGPELFVPRMSGGIIPNGGGGNITANFYGATRDDIPAMKRMIMDLQRQQVNFASKEPDRVRGIIADSRRSYRAGSPY